jgi:hypothetical protein
MTSCRKWLIAWPEATTPMTWTSLFI